MKFSRRLTVYKNTCPAELFEAIVKLKPECYRGGGSFHIETTPGDEAAARLVDDIIAMCDRKGLKPSHPDAAGAYTHDRHHHYEAIDLECAPFLALLGQKPTIDAVNLSQRDERGLVWLPIPAARRAPKIASIFPRPWIVVSNQTRKILEAGELGGLQFNEVSLRGDLDPDDDELEPDNYDFNGVKLQGGIAPGTVEPFWELRTSVILPKMTNSIPHPNVAFERFLIHGSYGEPHYRQSDLKLLGAFDIAFTNEWFTRGRDPWLIISQRFYQHCLKHEIKLKVRPVRVDAN